MDFKKTLSEAESVVNALGGLDAIPGGKRVTGAAHGAVHQAKAKADAAGLGVMFTALENTIEKNAGMDLDGDGDIGK